MARYKAHYAEVRKWLDSDGDLRGAVTNRAEAIANRARVLAPVLTGRYKSHIAVRDSRGWDGRVAADVYDAVPYAAAVEWGLRDIHYRGHHVIRRAAESL